MLIERVRQNKFFRAILTLMSGSIIAQAITVLASPLMTRLYTEEQIGEYTLIVTAVSMFGSVICARYDISIVSDNEEKNVYALIKLCLGISLAVSVLVGIGYAAYYHVLGSVSLHPISIFLWIVLLLFLVGVGNVLNSYNNRYKQYGLMSSAHVERAVGKEALLIGWGFLAPSTLGLLVSQLVNSVLGYWRQALPLRFHKKELKEVTAAEVGAVAKKHLKQPLFSVPATFANSFSYSSINLMVSALYGNVALAYYSMSFRMLGVPLQLISVNVSKAFFERASRDYDKTGRFTKAFLQSSAVLLAFAVPMVALLLWLAPFLFELFFGAGWGVSGVYVQYLAPMFGIRLIVGALTPTMTICKKQNVELVIQMLFVVAVLAAFLLCRGGADIKTFLLSITTAFSVVYLAFYLLMLKYSYSSGKKEKV